MALERGLGRGLDSLLRSTTEAENPEKDVKKLTLSQLVPGVHQPRKHFDENALNELAISIKNQGVVQPLIVRPQAGSSPQLYEIVAGERRWRAAKMAGLIDVPVLITQYSDIEAMTVALVENLQREDLNPLEEAEALQSLREAHKLSQEELAAKLGKSRSAVANSLRLLQLPEAIRQALGMGSISSGHGRALLAISDDKARQLVFEAVLQQNLSVRDVEAAADVWKRSGAVPEGILQSMTALEGAPGESMGEDMGDATSLAPGALADPATALQGAAIMGRKTSRRAPKPQALKDIQSHLRQAVHQGASISGTEEKGRIALPYTSRGELEFLLHLLGMSQDSGPQEADDADEAGETLQS